MLYKTFSKGQAPHINYPKPQQQKWKKPNDQKVRIQKARKKGCPQKAYVNYPKQVRQTTKYHQIDYVPRRKNAKQIQQEMDQYYSKPEVPKLKGRDQNLEKAKLQKRFQNQRGAMPKRAQLPALSEEQVDSLVRNMEIKEKAKKEFDQHEVDFQKVAGKQKKKKKVTRMEKEDNELSILFQSVVSEIEERQTYLESINHLKDKKLKAKIKREIMERVKELEHINKLLGK